MSHTFTVVNQERIVKISDAALLEPYTARVEAAANDAEASAATALAAAGPNYSTDAAGLAAVAEGEAYALDNGDGTITIKKKVSGVAVAQRTIIKDPSASTAAALIGTASGDMAEDLLSLIELPDQTDFVGSLGYARPLSGLTHSTDTEGQYNTLIGFGSGLGTGPTNQWGNTGVGYGACNFFAEGENYDGGGEVFGNTAVGYMALGVMVACFDNTACGSLALTNLSDGDDNCAFGIKSLTSLRRGANNIGVGDSALRHLVGGANPGDPWSSDNIAIGFDSGRVLADGTTELQHANKCIYIGPQTKSAGDDQINEIVIGSEAVGAGSNSVTIGNDDIVGTYLKGAIQVDGPSLQLSGATFGQIIFERESIGSWTLGNPSAGGTSNSFSFCLNGAAKILIDTGGVMQPAADNAQDFGASGARFKDFYTMRLKASTEVQVGGTKVLGAQGAAVADASNAAAAPTQAEFNALVTQFNTLLARVRAHGLIAT